MGKFHEKLVSLFKIDAVEHHDKQSPFSRSLSASCPSDARIGGSCIYFLYLPMPLHVPFGRRLLVNVYLYAVRWCDKPKVLILCGMSKCWKYLSDIIQTSTPIKLLKARNLCKILFMHANKFSKKNRWTQVK